MKIILRDDIRAMAQKTVFSYREVYALSLFEDIGIIEEILQMIAVSGMGVGMYLLQKGVPQDTVWRLLHDEAKYIKGG